MILDPLALDKLRNLGGDPLVGRMLGLFLENVPGRLDTARAACGSGDVPTLERVLHSLRSSSFNVGAQDLGDLAGRLEQMVEEGRLEEACSALPTLEARWDEVKPLLDEERLRSGGDALADRPGEG